jgi:hypothetical protein
MSQRKLATSPDAVADSTGAGVDAVPDEEPPQALSMSMSPATIVIVRMPRSVRAVVHCMTGTFG